MPGTLFVVATPLGNLGDWSPRARDVVQKAGLVLVEDTRVSHKLFESFDLHPRVRVFEKYREKRELDAVLAELLGGTDIALLSDAGTPGIADPGALLVDAALRAGVPVVAVAGPSILSAALSVSGVGEPPFTFHGYPPDKAGRRKDLFLSLRGDTGAHVLLLPPHDARTVLTELDETLPGRVLVLCRELTKMHESVLRGLPREILAALEKADAFRGEMALVIHGAAPETAHLEFEDLVAEARRLHEKHGLSGRELSDFLAFKTDSPRKLAYRAVEALKS
jgi:16S rRNA (cytidine1402-2'-O)-methyltransferase